MDGLLTSLAMILGILLRIAIPVIVTFLIIFFLRRLDEHWKKETDIGEGQLVKVGNVGCWEINNCPEDNRAKCKAYLNPDTPCWQVFRGNNSRLQERCIGCEVFRQAPEPVTT